MNKYFCTNKKERIILPFQLLYNEYNVFCDLSLTDQFLLSFSLKKQYKYCIPNYKYFRINEPTLIQGRFYREGRGVRCF